MALNFVTSAIGTAGSPLHVTVYDGLQNPIDPTKVTWVQLPNGVEAQIDPTSSPPGFNMISSQTGVQMDAHAQYTDANEVTASGLVRLTFNAPPLLFTSP